MGLITAADLLVALVAVVASDMSDSELKAMLVGAVLVALAGYGKITGGAMV